MPAFRRLLIRSVLPASWKLIPARAAASLEEFSATEADSAWQYVNALNQVTDNAYRSSLFNGALEEIHHSWLFKQAAAATSASVRRPVHFERIPLYRPERGIAEFLCYVYVGESDVHEQFGTYVRAVPPGAAREAFRSAQEDEEGHVQMAAAGLLREYGTKSKMNRAVLKIRVRRLGQAWTRFGKALGDISSTVILSAIYVVAGLLFTGYCRRRTSAGLSKAA